MAKLEYTKNSDTSISVKRDDKETYRGLPLFWAETDGKEVHIRSKIDNQIIINLSTKLGQEDEIIIDGTPYTDLKEATDKLNTFIGLGFKSGGSGGGTVIPNKYFFVDQADADSYFTSNPSELVNGLLVNIAGQYKLWQESTSSWIDATTVVQGPKGDKGSPGEDGQPGDSGPQGEPGQDGKDGKIQSLQQGSGINIDNTDPANPKISATGGGGGGTAADVSVDQSDFVKIYGDNVQDALQAIDGILSDEVPMPAPDDKIYGIKNQQYVEIPPVPTNLVKGVLVNGEPVVDPNDGIAKINWDVKVDGNSIVYDGVANIDLTEKLDKVRSSNLKQAIYGFDMYGSEQTVFPTDDPDRMPQPGAVVKRTSDGGIMLPGGTNAISREDALQLIYEHMPTVTTEEVTAMFTFSPQVAKPKAWMKYSAFSDPEIEIFIENAGDGTSDLTITAARGFGAYFNHTGSKALPIPGINPDTGMGALYPVTITGETNQAQTVITVPAQVQSATIKYTLGKTIVVPLASYYTYDGVDYPFERGNTPLSNFIGNSSGQSGYIINGRVIERTTSVQNIRFGDSYLSETIIPTATDVDTLAFVAYTGNGQGELDIRGLKNITTYPDDSFKYTSFKTLQIGSIDGSLITTVGDRVFYSLYPMVKILADTQAGGEAFRSKFPNLSTATIVVN